MPAPAQAPAQAQTISRARLEELVSTSEERSRFLALFTLVALGVALAAGLSVRLRAIAMVHEVTILDCPYSGNAAHTHTSDCYDSGANLVCPLEQRELHTHAPECYEAQRVLACGKQELAPHDHVPACYDQTGALTCGFDEHGLHVHTPACYDEADALTCGFDEKGAHTHSSACYDEHGALVCGLREGEPHIHTEACYEAVQVLTCGKEELTEEHVHGAGCFRTVLVDQDGNVVEEDEAEPVAADPADAEAEPDAASDPAAPEAAAPEAAAPEAAADPFAGMPAQTFEASLVEDGVVTMRVRVDAPAGAFPTGTTMRVAPVAAESIAGDVTSALTQDSKREVDEIVAVDISFYDASGAEIEPARQITVSLASSVVASGDDAVVVHLGDSGEVELVETLDQSQIEMRHRETQEDELLFDTQGRD